MWQLCAVTVVALDLVRGFEYEETELTSADYASLSQDNLGYSSAISGSFAIAGVPEDDELGNNAGAAYIFQQDEGTGEWTEHSRLTASDGSAGDLFGFSVSMSGNIAIVGCQNHDFNSLANVGGAYIFTYDESSDSWSETAQLVGSTSIGSDNCGYSVSISSNSAIMGCYDGDKAFIFEYDGNEWTETAALSGSGVFGFSVSIYDNIYAVVGDYANDDVTTNAGKAYVYTNSVGSVWSLVQEVTASDAGGSDNFGSSVSICQDWLFVGARYYDVTGAGNAGAVYALKNSDGTGASWDETQILTASDGSASAIFGSSVSINCDETNYYAVVGAPQDSSTGNNRGKAYVLDYDENENLWTETLGVQAADAANGDAFGASVGTGGGAQGNCWISGVPYRNEFPNAYPNVGAVFIYCPAQTAQPTTSPTAEIIETIAPTSSPSEKCEYTETCKAWGDPHFNTWDGQVHHFQGTGYFDYVKNCDESSAAYLPFKISARHDTCRGTYSCVEEVYVSIDDGAGVALIWNGENDATFASTGNNAVGTYSFERDGGDLVEYVVSKTGFEINFVYNGQSAMLRFHYSNNWLKIETTDCLKSISNICGLCGTLNGDKSDDFTRCDNLNVVDSTDVATVLTGSPWENTHEFGESCCNADLDALYLDESEQDCSVAPVPEGCDATCLTGAEIICEDLYEMYCTDCDGVSATTEWIESCAIDLCADQNCATGIVNEEYGVNQIVDTGCADEIVLDCILEEYYQFAHLF